VDTNSQVILTFRRNSNLLLVANAFLEELLDCRRFREDVHLVRLLGEELAFAVIDQRDEIKSDLASAIWTLRHGDVARIGCVGDGEQAIGWLGFGRRGIALR
jgi:hypothetical protein